MINMSLNGKRRDRKIQWFTWFTSRKAGAISSIDFHPTGEQLISAGEVRLTAIGCANFLQTLTPKVGKTEVSWEIMCTWLSRLEVIRFVVWWRCAATGWIANLESSWGSLDARGQTVLQLWMTKRYKKIQKVPWNIFKPEKLSKPFWCALADSDELIASSLTSKTFWLLPARCLALRSRP